MKGKKGKTDKEAEEAKGIYPNILWKGNAKGVWAYPQRAKEIVAHKPAAGKRCISVRRCEAREYWSSHPLGAGSIYSREDKAPTLS